MSASAHRLRITRWMRTEMLVTLGFVVALSCLSGLADARGFLHASRMWRSDGLVWFELARSAAAFVLGMGIYWISARFMHQLGIAAAESRDVEFRGTSTLGRGNVPAASDYWAGGVGDCVEDCVFGDIFPRHFADGDLNHG